MSPRTNACPSVGTDSTIRFRARRFAGVTLAGSPAVPRTRPGPRGAQLELDPISSRWRPCPPARSCADDLRQDPDVPLSERPRADGVSPTGLIDSAPTNYVGCFGSGLNAIADLSDDGQMDMRADGVFCSGAWRPLADCIDGTSNTVAVSESLLGPGGADELASAQPNPQTHLALIVPLTTVTVANCDQPVPGGVNRFVSSRGRVWAGQAYENTSYNHFFAPNSKRYDCFFWVAQGFKAARSRHPGGVQALRLDGSVSFAQRDDRSGSFARPRHTRRWRGCGQHRLTMSRHGSHALRGLLRRRGDARELLRWSSFD